LLHIVGRYQYLPTFCNISLTRCQLLTTRKITPSPDHPEPRTLRNWFREVAIVLVVAVVVIVLGAVVSAYYRISAAWEPVTASSSSLIARFIRKQFRLLQQLYQGYSASFCGNYHKIRTKNVVLITFFVRLMWQSPHLFISTSPQGWSGFDPKRP
jgi:hypothetical protein